jgi:hypothetical protein
MTFDTFRARRLLGRLAVFGWRAVADKLRASAEEKLVKSAHICRERENVTEDGH